MGAGLGTTRNQAKVESNPPLVAVNMPAGSAVWVEVTDHSEMQDVGAELRSLLIALLQSDAGFSLADSADLAAGTVRVDILQMGLTSSEKVNFDMAQGFGMGLTGAALGLGIGSGVGGRNGALWGTGIGLALGFTAGGALAAGSEDTWAMLADVQITAGAKASKGSAKAAGQEAPIGSRVAVTAQGIDMARESALATLQDALVQEIVGHVQAR